MSLKHPQERSVSYHLVHLKPVMSVLSLKLPLCELNTKVSGREGRRKAEGGRRREGERKREGDRSVGVRGEG